MTPLRSNSAATRTGARVRELRERSRASQQMLATRAEMHASNLARVERGTVNPSLDTLVRIAQALGTSVSDLVRDA